jgi:hypothetical protein
MDLKDVIYRLLLQVVQDICRSKFIGFPPKKIDQENPPFTRK